MSQYVYTMRRVGKVVPPKRVILKNISLNFFPGAKIGVLGLNGAGKSSLLKIMAGVDKDFEGEAIPQPNLRVGFLPQEPRLDPAKDVRGNVEEGLGAVLAAKKRLEEIYAAYSEPAARGHGRREDLGGRAAPGGAVPPAAVRARHAAARRADQPPRRALGAVARAITRALSRHRDGGHARPLLPRQRRRLDPRT